MAESRGGRNKRGIEEAIFGCIYTMVSGGQSSGGLVYIVFPIEFSQWLAFSFDPGIPWGLDPIQKLIAISQVPLTMFGDLTTFWIAFLGSVFLLLLCSFCVLYVTDAFKKDRFRFIWPLRLLRILALLLVTVLYMPILNVLLLTLKCDRIDGELVWSYYPEIECWGWPSGVASAISICLLVVYIPSSVFTSLVYFDSNPLSNNKMARVSGRESMRTLLYATFLTVIYTIWSGHPVEKSVCLLLCTSSMWFNNFMKLPFYHKTANRWMLTTYLMNVFSASCAVVVSSVNDEMHITLWVWGILLLPVGYLGWTLVDLRYKALYKAWVVPQGDAKSLFGKSAYLASSKLSPSQHFPAELKDTPMAAASQALVPTTTSEARLTKSGTAASPSEMSLQLSQTIKPTDEYGAKAAGDWSEKRAKKTLFRNRVVPHDTMESSCDSIPEDEEPFRENENPSFLESPPSPSSPSLDSQRAAANGSFDSDKQRSLPPSYKSEDPESQGLKRGKSISTISGNLLSESALVPTAFLVTTQSPDVFPRESAIGLATQVLLTHRTAQSYIRIIELFEMALAQFRGAAGVRIMYSNFLYYFADDTAGAREQVEKAKSQSPAVDVRFLIYFREKEWEVSEKENADIINTVEYQRSMQQARSLHQMCITDIRKFWATLLNTDSPVAVLPIIARRIQENQIKAQAVYRKLIDKHKNVELLRYYALFCNNIVNDVETADVYFEKAEILEEEMSSQTRTLNVTTAAGPGASGTGRGKRIQSAVAKALARTSQAQKRIALLQQVYGPESGMASPSGMVISQNQLPAKDDSGSETGSKASRISEVQQRSIKRRNMYRKNITERKSKAINRLFWSILAIVCLLLTSQIALFVYVQVSMVYFRESIDVGIKAGQTHYLAYTALMLTRRLQLQANDTASAALTTSSIGTNMDTFETIQNHLFIDRPVWSGELDTSWSAENLLIREYLSQSGTTINTTRNLFDSGSALIRRTRSLSEFYKETESLGAPWLYASNISSSRDFRYVLDNTPFTLVPAFISLNNLYESIARNRITVNLILTSAVFALSIVLLIAGSVLGFKPVFASIQSEREAVLKLFHAIPKNVVQRMFRQQRDLDYEGTDAEKFGTSRTARDNLMVDQENVTNAENDPLSKLYSRNILAFSSIALILSIAFTLTILFLIPAQYTGREINIVSETKMSLRSLFLGIQELIVNDTTTWTRTMVLTQMHQAIEESRSYLFDFKYGGGGVSGAVGRYDPLDNLLFGKNCADEDVLCAQFHGLNAATQTFIQNVETVMEYQAEQLTLNDSLIKSSLQMDAEILSAGYALVLQLLKDELLANLKIQTAFHASLMGINMVQLVALYILFFRKTIRRLNVEGTYTSTMLLMIPQETIQGVAEIKEYFESGANLSKHAVGQKLIAGVPMFASASRNFINIMAQKLRFRVFSAGTNIITQGEVGDAMYFLFKGRVQVIIKIGDGEEKAVAELHAGTCFGEMALITGEKRTATIRAKTICDIYLLSRKDFSKIIRKFPRYGEEFDHILETRKKADEERARKKKEEELEKEKEKESQTQQDDKCEAPTVQTEAPAAKEEARPKPHVAPLRLSPALTRPPSRSKKIQFAAPGATGMKEGRSVLFSDEVPGPPPEDPEEDESNEGSGLSDSMKVMAAQDVFEEEETKSWSEASGEEDQQSEVEAEPSAAPKIKITEASLKRHNASFSPSHPPKLQHSATSLSKVSSSAQGALAAESKGQVSSAESLQKVEAFLASQTSFRRHDPSSPATAPETPRSPPPPST